MSSEPPNPIELRLAQLQSIWSQFIDQADARICRWMLRHDEVQMLYGFVESTYSEESEIQAGILNFQTIFPSLAQYSVALTADLQTMIEQDGEALAENGIDIDWRPEAPDWQDERNPARYFLRNLAEFARRWPSEGLIVAFLDPAEYHKDLEKWLFSALETGIDPRLRLMIADYEGFNLYERIAAKYPQQVKTYTPNLDMPAAVRQLAAKGNPADPGVQFRKAFIELSEAASRQKTDDCLRLREAPIAIAREQGWPHLEIAVHALVGSAFLNAQRYPDAMQTFDHARLLAESAEKQGNPLGATLKGQMLMNLGSTAVAQRDLKGAIGWYRAAAESAEQLKEHFNALEARRMEGFCLQHTGQTDDAWKANLAGLQAAEQLDDNTRGNSSLPWLGQALLDLAYRLGRKSDHAQLTQKLNTLSPGWEQKLENRKSAL